MNKFKLFLILFAIFTMGACQIMQSTQIEIVRPAKVSLPVSINKIAIANHSLYNHNVKKDSDFHKDLVVFDSLCSQDLVALVAFEISKSPRFDSIVLINNNTIRPLSALLKPLNNDKVKYDIKKNNVDALLSLEALSLKDTLVPYSYFDGYTTLTRLGFGLIVSSFWRIYNNNGVPFTENIFKDTLVIDDIENLKHFSRIISRNDGRAWLANKIMQQHFLSISDHIAPYWYSVERVFYKSGNNAMLLAAEYAQNDDWLKAATIWNSQAKSKKIMIASSACYNMALACEVQGKLNLAKVWIDKSIALKENYYNKAYKQVVEARIKEINKLNTQFGIQD